MGMRGEEDQERGAVLPLKTERGKSSFFLSTQ